MKKRIAAVVLGITLSVTTVFQAGAAVFVDADDAIAAEVFEDTGMNAEAENDVSEEPEVTTEPEVSTAPEAAEEITPAPEIQEQATPTPEQITPASEISEQTTPAPENPEETFQTPEAEEDPNAEDVEIFNAGEDSEEADNDASAEEATEFLTAAEEKILESNWVSVKGKWKLRKPSDISLSAAAVFEEAVPSDEGVPAAETLTEEVSAEVLAEEAPAEEEVPEETGEAVFSEEIVSPQTDVPAEETVSSDEAELNTASQVEYYTAADGIVHIQTYKAGDPGVLVTEGDYYFDEDGYLITGQYSVPAGTAGSKYAITKEHFFMDQANAVRLSTTSSAAACTPTNSNMGQMQKKYWLWTGKTFRYYSVNGGFLTVNYLTKYYTKKGTFSGYFKINGAKYFLQSDGTPRVGHITVTEGKKTGQYYAQPAKNSGDIPGKVFCAGWLRLRDSKGVIQWRRYRADGRYWERGIVAVKLDKTISKSVGDYTYLLDADGYILKNTMVQAANGYYYCSNKLGRVYKNKMVRYNNVRYYFTANGRRATWTNSWHRVPAMGNRYYYFGSTAGQVVEKTGWQRVVTTTGASAGWFYFNKKGNHYLNRLTKTGRYFRTDGRLASGVTTVNGKTYFFQGSTTTTPKGVMYKSTWIHYDNKWYYAGSDGALYKNGWNYINSYYYYFNSDCTVKTDASVTRNGVSGYVDSRGRFYAAGWLIVNDAKNQVKYVDPESGGFLTNCSKVINGLKYYFDKDGYRINDLSSMYSGKYYLVADRINGVMTVYDSTRTIPIKSIRISVGLASTPTWPTNKDMTLKSSLRWQPLMGNSWGQYGTHVEGAGNGGIFVHSVAGSSRSYYNLSATEYNKLGSPASHGCIRCCVADARWVYYNCNGSTIRIIDGTYNANESFKGPLGRPALVPLYGSRNFDPTDNLAWH